MHTHAQRVRDPQNTLSHSSGQNQHDASNRFLVAQGPAAEQSSISMQCGKGELLMKCPTEARIREHKHDVNPDKMTQNNPQLRLKQHLQTTCTGSIWKTTGGQAEFAEAILSASGGPWGTTLRCRR